jgi:hypothetical protein
MEHESPACQACSELLPELALGILTGRERAEALVHLESCPRCAAELEQLSAVADSLLEVVPGVDPPLGFEVRALERMKPELRAPIRWRPSWRVLAASVTFAVAIAVAGVVIGANVSSKAPVSYSATGDSSVVAHLTAAHGRGEVILYGGHPGWFVMIVDGMNGRSDVRCVLTMKDGSKVDLGNFWLNNGTGTWSTKLPVALDSISQASVQTPGGQTIATATIRA